MATVLLRRAVLTRFTVRVQHPLHLPLIGTPRGNAGLCFRAALREGRYIILF
jgi:hypothetical protein